MPYERRPASPRPKDRIPKDAVKHRVADGENWYTIADRYGKTTDNIIYSNFGTYVPEEINWYLRHYVGCNKATTDGANWMFSSSAAPGIIYIPGERVGFDDPVEIIVPPLFFVVRTHPASWTPPEGGSESAKEVVKVAPWQHDDFAVGTTAVKGRKSWSGGMPIWKNEVVYYNIKDYRLIDLMQRIVVHHTDNNFGVWTNERKQQYVKGYAALAYHFFIAKDGVIYEGRPMEIMGGHAGEGAKPGVANDPDFGSIGIVLEGAYHTTNTDPADRVPPQAQLDALEKLAGDLAKKYSVNQMLLHREVHSTACPGDFAAAKIKEIRTRLGMQGK